MHGLSGTLCGRGGSRRTKAYKEWAEAHEAEGLEVITAEEHARALETAEAASKHPLLSELLVAKGTQVERAIVWQGALWAVQSQD